MNTIKAIWAHVTDWAEAYIWPLISLLLVIGGAHLYYSLTGRAPADPPDFIPNLAGRFVLGIVAILLTSITKEAVVGWRRDDEPVSITITRICVAVVILALWIYALLH